MSRYAAATPRRGTERELASQLTNIDVRSLRPYPRVYTRSYDESSHARCPSGFRPPTSSHHLDRQAFHFLPPRPLRSLLTARAPDPLASRPTISSILTGYPTRPLHHANTPFALDHPQCHLSRNDLLSLARAAIESARATPSRLRYIDPDAWAEAVRKCCPVCHRPIKTWGRYYTIPRQVGQADSTTLMWLLVYLDYPDEDNANNFLLKAICNPTRLVQQHWGSHPPNHPFWHPPLGDRHSEDYRRGNIIFLPPEQAEDPYHGVEELLDLEVALLLDQLRVAERYYLATFAKAQQTGDILLRTFASARPSVTWVEAEVCRFEVPTDPDYRLSELGEGAKLLGRLYPHHGDFKGHRTWISPAHREKGYISDHSHNGAPVVLKRESVTTKKATARIIKTAGKISLKTPADLLAATQKLVSASRQIQYHIDQNAHVGKVDFSNLDLDVLPAHYRIVPENYVRYRALLHALGTGPIYSKPRGGPPPLTRLERDWLRDLVRDGIVWKPEGRYGRTWCLSLSRYLERLQELGGCKATPPSDCSQAWADTREHLHIASLVAGVFDDPAYHETPPEIPEEDWPPDEGPLVIEGEGANTPEDIEWAGDERAALPSDRRGHRAASGYRPTAATIPRAREQQAVFSPPPGERVSADRRQTSALRALERSESMDGVQVTDHGPRGCQHRASLGGSSVAAVHLSASLGFWGSRQERASCGVPVTRSREERK